MVKYFKKELWRQMNDTDSRIRMAAEKEWTINAEKYQKEFEDVKRKLPPDLVRKLSERDDFHDHIIERIDLSILGKMYLCDLFLTDGEEPLHLAMKNVANIRVNVTDFTSCIMGKLTWGYCEFSLLPSGNMHLSVLCDLQNEMEIEFEGIELM